MILPITLRGVYIEQMTDDEFFRVCPGNHDLKNEHTAEGRNLRFDTNLSGEPVLPGFERVDAELRV